MDRSRRSSDNTFFSTENFKGPKLSPEPLTLEEKTEIYVFFLFLCLFHGSNLVKIGAEMVGNSIKSKKYQKGSIIVGQGIEIETVTLVHSFQYVSI